VSAAGSADPRSALVAVAKAFIASEKFVTSVDGTPFQEKVNGFTARIDESKATRLDVETVARVAKEVIGQEARDLVKSVEFTKLLKALRDSVVAIKYVRVGRCPPPCFHWTSNFSSHWCRYRKNTLVPLRHSPINSGIWS
jgi:hypothetical protein